MEKIMKTIHKDNWLAGNTPFSARCECTISRGMFTLDGLAARKFKRGKNIDGIPAMGYLGFPGGIGDHTRFWTKDGKPFAITTEPYSLDYAKLQALKDECEELGLIIEWSDHSEWNAGCCKWVEIRRPD
jgi:hypothetical protein